MAMCSKSNVTNKKVSDGATLNRRGHPPVVAISICPMVRNSSKVGRVLPRHRPADVPSPSRTPIRARPIHPPSLTRNLHPVQSLGRCSPDILVEHGGTLVKTSRMPRVRKSKPLKIEMVAEFVAEGAEERSERGDLFPNRRARPYTDHHSFGSVVSKKLCNRVFPHSQWSGCKHSDTLLWDAVELRCCS
jgi:hypothetical protein